MATFIESLAEASKGTRRLLWLLAVMLAARPAVAAPVIGRIMPPAGQRGTECEVTITGSRLDGAEELFFEDGLIEQVSLEQPDAKTVMLRLRIPEDCPLGSHRIRLRSPAGLSDLRTFAVIDSPIRIEGETTAGNKTRNDSPEAAEVLERTDGNIQTIAGVIRREDVDAYRVHLKQGEKISASLCGVRLNHTPFDPAVELVDAAGFVVASCDDHSLVQQDAILSARVDRDGDYFLRVRESAYLGDDNCVYLLHVGRFPTPQVALPPGGQAGATLDVTWLGDSDGPWTTSLTLPEQEGRRDAALEGLAAVTAVRDGIPAAETVPLRLTTLPVGREVEPNNIANESQLLPTPTAAWGQLQQPGDVDWLRFEAAAGTKWSVRAWGRRLGSPIDLVLNAYRDDDKRQKITGNDDSEGPDSLMTVTVPQEGSFLVRIDDQQGRGGETFVWWLEVTPVEPAMTVAVPPTQTKTQLGLIAQVPRGNRTAVLLNASRTDSSDDVLPQVTALPAGVQATATPLPRNAPSSLVVFEAQPDAALGAAMAAVSLEVIKDETRHSLGGVRQPTELVHGNPNRTCWRQSVSDRLPVAVVEQVPVQIELVPPAVPLVQSGRLDLKVRVTREEGFEGGIRLSFPFSPPGVGAASGVNVPADASEVAYPLNASDKASLGSWGVAVVATVTPKGDLAKTRPTFTVASRPVNLDIAEPLLQLAIDRTAAEQGSELFLTGKFSAPAAVAAKAMLLGLPANCTAKEVSVVPDDTEVRFPVTVGGDAPVGKHGAVVCELHVPQGDAAVIHTVKVGELRIDKPLPAVATAEKAKPVDKKVAASPQPQTLSRRERLRQQAQALATAGEKATASQPEN